MFGSFVALTLVAAACGGSDSADDSAGSDESVATAAADDAITTATDDGAVTDDDEAANAEPVADGDLAQVTFSLESAAPFDDIELSGWTGDLDDIGVVAKLDGGDVPVPVFIDGDLPRFVALFRPDDPFSSGPVEYQVVSVDGVGPTIAVETAALERAPGAFVEFMDVYESAIIADAVDLGADPAVLEGADFEATPPELIGHHLALRAIDDGTENDLRSAYVSDEVGDDGRELADAIAASVEAESLLARPATPQGLLMRQALPPATLSMPSGSSLRQSDGNCFDWNVQIDGAADLAKKMTEASVSRIDADDPRRKVLDDINSVTTAAGFIPGYGWLAGLFGAGFVSYETWQNAQASTLPSAFINLTFDASDTEFPEDAAAPGAWSNVEAYVSSDGWRADADLTKTLLAWASPITSAYSGLNRVSDGFVLDVALFLRDNVANQFVAGKQAENGGVFATCAQDWIVDVTGLPWTSGEFVFDRFSIDSDLRTYSPIETGLELPVDDVLQVEIERKEFGGAHHVGERPIRVLPIDVDVPDEVFVDQPGDEFALEATVANALDSSLDWDAGAGGWRGDATLTRAGEIVGAPAAYERTHVTAGTEAAFPYVVSVSSASTTGLRADGDPPRVGTTVVRLNEIIVSPSGARVPPGGSVQYEARNRAGESIDVEWSATGGDIGADGVFVAGETPGFFAVTATATANSAMTASVPVEVLERCDVEDLIGTWRLRAGDFFSQIGTTIGGAGNAEYVSGQYVVTLEEGGNFTAQRDRLRFDITGAGQAIQVTIDTTDRGTWSVDPTTATISVVETSTDGTVTLTADGQTLPGGSTSDAAGASWGGSGTYECDDDVFTLTVSQQGITVTSKLDRVG